MKQAIWELKIGEKSSELQLWKLKDAAKESFVSESDNYKQRLVFDLLESVKNKDQNRFFYLLLRSINKPKENFKELWNELERNYDILPEEAFINLAYSIIIGIMSSYQNKAKGGRNESEQ